MFAEHLLRAEAFEELGIPLMGNQTQPTLPAGAPILGKSWLALPAWFPPHTSAALISAPRWGLPCVFESPLYSVRMSTPHGHGFPLSCPFADSTLRVCTRPGTEEVLGNGSEETRIAKGRG